MSQIKVRVAVAELLFALSIGFAVVAHYLQEPWKLLLEIQLPLVFGMFGIFLV